MLLKYLLPSIAWAFFILIILGIPQGNVTSSEIELDKVVHSILFALQVLFLIVAFKKQYRSLKLRYYAISFSIVIAIVYGAVMELIQMRLISGRDGDWFDFIADVFGAFFGYILFKLIYGNTIMRAS